MYITYNIKNVLGILPEIYPHTRSSKCVLPDAYMYIAYIDTNLLPVLPEINNRVMPIECTNAGRTKGKFRYYLQHENTFLNVKLDL